MRQTLDNIFIKYPVVIILLQESLTDKHDVQQYLVLNVFVSYFINCAVAFISYCITIKINDTAFMTVNLLKRKHMQHFPIQMKGN